MKESQMGFPEFCKYVGKHIGKKPSEVRDTLQAVKECLLEILPQKRNVTIFKGCCFVPRTIEKHEYKSPFGEEGIIDDYITYSVHLTNWFKKQIRMHQGVTDTIVNIGGKWYKEKDLQEQAKRRKEEELREKEEELMPQWYGEKGWDTEVPEIE